uniref:transposase n=5 Tax=Marinococcus halotolerans TaxID=301092 RepID=UPI0003B3C6F8
SSRYPSIRRVLDEHPTLLTFYDFPSAIWRSLYSTNLIESFNKQLKKYVKRKEQFPNEASIERFLVSRFDAYNQKFSTRCHLGFAQAQHQLEEMFQRQG